MARTRISDFLTWTSISLSFDPTQVVCLFCLDYLQAVLLANQGALCHRLEELSQCIIHINKSLQRISVEGGASSLQLLKNKFTLILSSDFSFQSSL